MAPRLWFVLAFLRYSSQILRVTHITTAASTAFHYCEWGLGIFPLTPPQGCWCERRQQQVAEGCADAWSQSWLLGGRLASHPHV